MNDIFLKVINMSISAGWLILVIILIRFILKKAPKWINVLLWAFVAIRLICPISIESSLSLLPDLQIKTQDIVTDFEVTGTGEILDSQGNLLIEKDLIKNTQGTGQILDADGNVLLEKQLKPVTDHKILFLKERVHDLAPIWLIGIILMCGYALCSYLHLKRKLSMSVPIREGIRQSEYINSPFVLGVFRPVIYLPYSIDRNDIIHVIAHEQAHIRRKDHWWKPLGFLLLAIHWFNPLVWLAYILLCRDIELACDEKVIKELGSEEKADYTQALLGCSVNRRNIAACPLAFGEVGVKERVKSVMNYKKPAFWLVILAVIICIAVAVCFLTDPRQDSFSIRIVVPAGTTEEIIYQEDFAYSDEEISPLGNKITIFCGEGLGDTEVVLKPIEVKEENAYEPTYLTPGMPVKMDVEKGAWFKVGVNIQNPTEEDIIVYVKVENVKVRIADEVTPDYFTFEAEILEIHDGYFLVEPVPGSTELNCADRIEVPMKNMEPSPEPQVGDIIVIQYNGMMQETYPAAIGEVYSIRVRQEEVWDLIPMVMVDGQLYLTTGCESQKEPRGDAFDGEITSQVDGSEQPTKNDQSNFGTGYGYQYGTTEGTIEICMNGKWWIYATEEAREKVQFPTSSETGRGNEIYRYFLTVGAEGVVRFEVSTPNDSGGFQKANGAAYEIGDRVWLESLDGCKDLRGLEIAALDKDGEVIWTASIPNTEDNVGFTHLKIDDWEITDGL